MKKKKYIAFIGDSFCAFYEQDMPIVQLHQARVNFSAYPSISARHYQYNIAPYGFVGRSWWYSWSKFWKEWEHKLDQIAAIVFTHTNRERINSATTPEFPLMANYTISTATPDMVKAQQNYFKYIHDYDFQGWAQESYFKMLKEKFNNIQTIHLHCFPHTVPLSHLLPGVIFTTPLIHISIGEIRGPKEKIVESFSDGRANHLNSYNNQVLADIIIQSLDNYQPGQYELPIERFEQHNPNAAKWPMGKYWTKT